MLKLLLWPLRAAVTGASRSFLSLACVFFLCINVLTLTSASVQAALASSLGALGVASVYGALDARAAAKDRTIRRERSRNKALQGKLRQAKAGKAGALRANKVMQSRVKAIGGAITDRTLKSATLNVSSIPAESVPWFGIATVVAVTAAELHMACDNISDMSNLYEALDIDTGPAQSRAERTCLDYIDTVETQADRLSQAGQDIARYGSLYGY